jgi:hypothetical protein
VSVAFPSFVVALQRELKKDEYRLWMGQQLTTLGNGNAGITVLSHESTLNVIGAFMRAYPNISSSFKQIVPIHTCASAY